MLEERDYRLNELKQYFHTGNKQNTDNKLNRYQVEYTIDPTTARSRNPIYHITRLGNPLRLYCVFDLGFSPQTDFHKLRDFLFYFLGNPDFAWRPMEMMEEYLRKAGHGMSRQTISTKIKKLEELNYICPVGEFVYYKVYKDCGVQKHKIISKNDYSAAWSIYWECKERDYDSSAAYHSMYNRIGGVPRKQIRPMKNAIYSEDINRLYDMVCDSFVAEYGGQE